MAFHTPRAPGQGQCEKDSMTDFLISTHSQRRRFTKKLLHEKKSYFTLFDYGLPALTNFCHVFVKTRYSILFSAAWNISGPKSAGIVESALGDSTDVSASFVDSTVVGLSHSVCSESLLSTRTGVLRANDAEKSKIFKEVCGCF